MWVSLFPVLRAAPAARQHPGIIFGVAAAKKRPDFDAFGPFLCEGASGIGEGRSAEEPPGRGRDATTPGLLGPSPRLTSHISSCFPAPLPRIHPSLSKSALLSQPARNSTRLRFIPVASVSLHHDIISLPSFFLPLTFLCDVSLQRAQTPPQQYLTACCGSGGSRFLIPETCPSMDAPPPPAADLASDPQTCRTPRSPELHF